MSTNDPIEPVKATSRFSILPHRISHNDRSFFSYELPFINQPTTYQHVPLQASQAPEARPYTSGSQTKTTIFATDANRVKYSLLRGSRRKRVWEIVFKLFLSLAAIIFLVLPILAYRLDGEEVEEMGGYGRRIINLIQYGPTIFPIIFAAITGNFLHAVALRLAERGTTIGILEQLTRSVTISSTITTPFLIRSYNFLSGVLWCLWAVSPLGGQASLRILRTAYVEVRTDLPVNYLDPLNQSSFVEVGADVGLSLTETNSIYVSSLLSSAEIKSSPLDSWRNIKIPMIEIFESNITATKDSDGWYEIPFSNVTYSSLLGSPLFNLSTNSTADIQSGYAMISCTFLEVIDKDLCESGNTTDCFNTTAPVVEDWNFPAHPRKDDESANVEYIVIGFNSTQTNQTRQDVDQTAPMDLRIQSLGENGYSVGHCQLSQTFVEAEVDCLLSECRVSRIRRTDIRPKRPPLFVKAPSHIPHNFFLWFARVTPPGHVGFSNPSQLYIVYPEDPFAHPEEWLDIANVGQELFGTRMTQLINTFLSSTYGGGLYLGSIPINENGRMPFSQRPVNFKTSTGRRTDLKHVYVVQKSWASITLLSSVLLLSMGVGGAIVGFYTLTPDVLTSMSVLASESPWFDTVKEGTTLDGDDKAALLKHRIVRLGDVKRFEEVGYIALGTVDTEAVGVGGLSTDRVYR
ncbi:hypothetical protein ABW19_dt0202043 [Dactylella cylindrospora]|nr:hypothetical protein ABW19_dt0202043 [Dactylella cylindrospora]